MVKFPILADIHTSEHLNLILLSTCIPTGIDNLLYLLLTIPCFAIDTTPLRDWKIHTHLMQKFTASAPPVNWS